MKTPFHYALALGMLITGSTNTISTKAADLVNTQSRYGTTVQFQHPFFQALCSESCCWSRPSRAARCRSAGPQRPSLSAPLREAFARRLAARVC